MPAVRAALIQSVSILFVASASALMSALAGVDLTLLYAALLQAGLAVGLAAMLREPRWWLVMHAVFLPGALVLLALDVPSHVFFVLFIVTLGLFGRIFRTRVPYYPTPKKLLAQIVERIPEGAQRFVDLGSGFGGVALGVNRGRPALHCVGVELAYGPFLVSKLRSWFRSRCEFRREDWMECDLSEFDVVYVYLSPVVMDALWEKARREMRPGSVLMSCEFDVPRVAPCWIVVGQGGSQSLYGWVM